MIFNNSTHAFEYLYYLVMTEGIYHAGTRALFGVNFKVNNPQDKVIETPWRQFSEKYSKAEWEWYLSGNPNAEEISKIARIWKYCQDEHGNVNSNYGYHWFRELKNGKTQYDAMIELLTKESETRRAVLSHYDYNEIHRYSRDTPCNLSIQFLIHGKYLILQVFCRSQDLVFGFCNDQYQWANLQMKVIDDLPYDLEPGYVIYHIGHLHVYPRHFDLKRKWLDKQTKQRT